MQEKLFWSILYAAPRSKVRISEDTLADPGYSNLKLQLALVVLPIPKPNKLVTLTKRGTSFPEAPETLNCIAESCPLRCGGTRVIEIPENAADITNPICIATINMQKATFKFFERAGV